MIHGTVLNERTTVISTGTPWEELWITNGTFMFDFSSDGGDWKRDQVTFDVGLGVYPIGNLLNVTVTGAPTAFSMVTGSDNAPAAIALDEIHVEASPSGRIIVTGDVAVKGIAAFWRLGFQVQALVRRIPDASS
jgi:hypothetical protein